MAELKTVALTCGHHRSVAVGIALLIDKGFLEALLCLHCKQERPVDVGR